MKLIVADDSVYKYFIEYMTTFESYIPITKSQLDKYKLEDCEEIIAVQRGTWLPENVYQYKIRIGIVNTEQLCDKSVMDRVIAEINHVAEKTKHGFHIYDYSTTNCKFLEKEGFAVIYHPYRSSPFEKDFLQSLQSVPKRFDIGFVGAINNRRQYILDALQSAGISICIINDFGKERDAKIAECRYIMNIHYASHFTIFESIRCNRWLDAGYLVISETSTDTPRSSLLFQSDYDTLVSYTIQLLSSNREFDKITKYIFECIQPRDATEYIECTEYSNVDYETMRQDGCMVVYSNTTDIFSQSQDYLQIENKVLLRRNFPLAIEWLHENGEIHFNRSRDPIYRRFIPPPIETVDHVFLISQILKATNSSKKTYVEYGVRNGTSIEAISELVATAYGVDISDYTPRNHNIQFFKMLTDSFSEKQLNTIEFHYAFIDADHSSKQVIVDFEYIYKYIQNDGYIFLHDTYPCDPIFLRSDYCNDCYKTPLIIRKKYPEIEMITLPLNPGFTIVHKR